MQVYFELFQSSFFWKIRPRKNICNFATKHYYFAYLLNQENKNKTYK